MENKKVEIGKSRGNQIQGVKAVIEFVKLFYFDLKNAHYLLNILFTNFFPK